MTNARTNSNKNVKVEPSPWSRALKADSEWDDKVCLQLNQKHSTLKTRLYLL